MNNAGRGIEDAAREARYQVFEQQIAAGDYLFSAHHGDDQAETLLLRLLRGAGPRGLAAMARQRPLGAGILVRPLLEFTRADLETYAAACGLVWVEDESNRQDKYDRNYLRNQVIPLLRDRWPAFSSKWQQTAELCAANEELINALAEKDLGELNLLPESIGSSVSLEGFGSLSEARRYNLLRYWLRGQGLSIPGQQHLHQIERQIVLGRQDAEAQVSWGDVSLRVFRERLYALPLADLPVPAASDGIPIEPHGELRLPTGAILCFARETASAHLLNPHLPNLNIRFRGGGERCKPAGRAHSQTLKRLLQDYGVAPWLRETLPLIYSGDQLVAVADLWVCEGYQSQSDGYRLIYDPRRR